MQRQTREIRLQKSQTQCMGKYSCMARDKISFGTCDTLLQKLYKTKFSQVWEDKHIRYLKRFTLHRIQRSELIIFQGVLSILLDDLNFLIFDTLDHIDWNDIIYNYIDKENIYVFWCRLQIIPVKMRYCTSFTLSVKAIYFTFQHFLSVVTLHSKY